MSKAVPAMVIVHREAASDQLNARNALGQAKSLCHDICRCFAVESEFFKDLWDLKDKSEFQMNVHIHDRSPLGTAPVAVVIGFIKTLQHHMPILAKCAFRPWTESLTVVLDKLFLPISWDLLSDMMGKVISSAGQQLRADEVRVQSAENRLAVCQRCFDMVDHQNRSLALLFKRS